MSARFSVVSRDQAERYPAAPFGVAVAGVALDSRYQSNKRACGGARDGGNREAISEAPFSWRWVRGVVQGCTVYGPKDGIFSMTTGSWMQAITLTAPPHALHVSMSILKTRFSRCAQVMATRRSTGVFSWRSSDAMHLLPFPLFAGVTEARCLLLGAKTP